MPKRYPIRINGPGKKKQLSERKAGDGIMALHVMHKGVDMPRSDHRLTVYGEAGGGYTSHDVLVDFTEQGEEVRADVRASGGTEPLEDVIIQGVHQIAADSDHPTLVLDESKGEKGVERHPQNNRKAFLYYKKTGN